MKRMKMLQKNNKGFTLVELIIVVAIIAMLIAMIAPNLTSFLDTASDTTLSANAKTAYTSVNAWLTQQRVAGTSVLTFDAAHPLTIALDSATHTTLEVSSTQTGFVAADYASLTTMFNAGEFNNSTEISVVTNGYTVVQVTWAEDTDSGVYPQ